jgi:uncharacterized surface protein with fasciclin (FAS1) repeats
MILKLKAAAMAAAAAVATVTATVSIAAPTGNIVAGAMRSNDHKTLVAAVKAADLVGTLASGGPFTVFAPTDAAFGKLPDGTVANLLQPANRDQLRSVLSYHVVPGKVTSAELVAMIRESGGEATLTTVQGGAIKAKLSGGNVVLTDAKGGTARVIAADLDQSNGVIHVTDAVSLPM